MRLRVSTALGAAVAVAAALSVPDAADPELVNQKLRSHTVARDGQGRILAWYRPERRQGYDRVLRVAWDFIEHKVPRDRRWRTRLPVYLVSSVFDGNTLQGSYWQHNPASLYGQFVDSAVAWYAYSGDRDAVAAVRRMLDYQLRHGTTPANWAWRRVPFATACGGDREYGRCVAGMRRPVLGGIETDKVGELGTGYALFYELTGDRRYRDAAIACADALARHVRRGDAEHTPWPFRIDGRSGRVLNNEEYGGLVVAPIRLFDELIRLGAGSPRRYAAARDLAWKWMLRHPLNPKSRAWRKWTGYFEDTRRDVLNLNQAAPTMTAHYLLTHPSPDAIDPQWRDHVTDLIEWVRDYFGRGPFFGAWGIDEQHRPGQRGCCSDAGLGSDTARWGAMNALHAERTGDTAAREQAFRALNYATYFADDDGRVSCCGSDFRNPYWFDDGYSDYLRHFNWGMAALPELAPRSENHLLRSSSVVQNVTYGSGAVAYRTFHPDGVEVLRLDFRPASVTNAGGSLQQRAALDAPGFTVATVDDDDYVVRIRRNAGRDVVVSGAP